MKIKILENLFQYRELLKTTVKKEIRGKYKGSFMGILWSFLNPLLQVLVYSIVFPFIMKNREPNYITFLVCGILPWNWFTSIVSMGTQTFIVNAGIIKKVYFPREILPISSATAGLVNFLIQSPIILFFLAFSSIGVGWTFFLFPLIALAEYLFILGTVLLTSAIQVYVRDLEYIINFLISMIFYATPILYSQRNFESSSLGIIFSINPIAVIIVNYRKIFIERTLPNFKSLCFVFVVSLILIMFAMWIFRKLEKGFAEEL